MALASDKRRETLIFSSKIGTKLESDDEDADLFHVIPRTFLKKMRSFMKNPSEKPGAIDCGVFLCEHDAFLASPKPSEFFNDEFTAVRHEEWVVLKRIYGSEEGREITFRRTWIPKVGTGGNVGIVASPPVCNNCWEADRVDFVDEKIFVQRIDTRDDAGEGNAESTDIVGKGEVAIYTKRGTLKRTSATAGSTGSKRRNKPFFITASKSDSVRDVKVKILERTSISPINQALYLSNGVELTCNEDTLESLGVKKEDVLRMFEIPDIDEEEEAIFLGFSGTELLG